MKTEGGEAWQDGADQPKGAQGAPWSVSQERFQRELDRLISANPGFEAPRLRRPSWLNESAAGAQWQEWALQKKKWASKMASLMKKIKRR